MRSLAIGAVVFFAVSTTYAAPGAVEKSLIRTLRRHVKIETEHRPDGRATFHWEIRFKGTRIQIAGVKGPLATFSVVKLGKGQWVNFPSAWKGRCIEWSFQTRLFPIKVLIRKDGSIFPERNAIGRCYRP